MKFADIPTFAHLTECPFCGCDEFYTKLSVHGTLRLSERFDGEEVYNGQMYEGLVYDYIGEKAYCQSCDRYLGNRENGVLSKKAEKAIREKMSNG